MRGWRVSRGREDCEPGAGTFAPGLNALLPRRPPGGRWLGWQAKSAGPGSGAGSAVSSYCLKKLLGLRLGGTASGSTERSCTTEGKDITYDIGLAGSLPANSDADGCVDHGTVEKGVGPTDDNFKLDCVIDARLFKKREKAGQENSNQIQTPVAHGMHASVPVAHTTQPSCVEARVVVAGGAVRRRYKAE